MWICANNAFLSIVEDRNDPERLLVRGRYHGDIEALFPEAEVVEGTGSDYRFRAFLPRADVAARVAQAITGIDYGNFKDSVRERWRHDLYLDFWSRAIQEQRRH